MSHLVMTPEQLAAIEARHAAATEGPWDYIGTSVGAGFIVAANGKKLAQLWDRYEDDFTNHEANGQFLAHSWADVRDLLAEVKRLRGEKV